MRKVIYSLLVAVLMASCNSVEKDAQKLADLMCKAQENRSNPIESLKFVDDIEKTEDKYSGEEKRELEKLAEKLYLKQCGDKNVSDFFNSVKEDSSKEDNDYNSSESNSSSNDDELDNEFSNWKQKSEDSYAEVDKLLDKYERYVTEFSVMYNSAYSGDVSAMSKYPKLLDRAKKLGISLNNASNKGKLNPDQIKRLDVINSRLLGFEPDLFD